MFPLVVVSILSHAEFGRNDYREDALHFNEKSYLEDSIQISCNLSFRLVELVEDNFEVLAFFFWSKNGLSWFKNH